MSSTATDETALTARNRSVDVDAARLVYRRFGNLESAAPPLLGLQHFHHLPNAQLRIYADAGHGFLDQYPEQFAGHVNAFLGGG